MDGRDMSTSSIGTASRLFAPLARAWRSGDAALKAGACLELRNLSGTSMGGFHGGQETNLLLFGDGTLRFFRRGDFGERGNRPPGLWRGSCDSSVADALWNALEELTEEDFQGRAADPGDPVTHLQARCGGKAAHLTWGPAEMGRERPGVDALSPLRMLLEKAQEEKVWSLSLRPGTVRRDADGLTLSLTLSNAGPQPVHVLVGPPGSGPDLAFKHAVDESDESGEPALQVNWEEAEVRLPEEDVLRVVPVAEGQDLEISVRIPGSFASDGRYLGQFTYTQLRLGESLAGQPVFQGVAFTEIFSV